MQGGVTNEKIYISILQSIYCTNIVMETGLGSDLKDTEQVGGGRAGLNPKTQTPQGLTAGLNLWGKTTA